MVRGWFLLVVGLLMVACGGTPAASYRAPFGQKITIDDQTFVAGGSDTVRFGRMSEGEIATKPLQLTNSSSKPLVITHIERTCGCTTLDYEPQPLMPDSTMQLRLRFDARGEWGWQLKRLQLYTSQGGKPLTLWVEADVE